MQFAAHVMINTEKILVLVRVAKSQHHLKLRTSGQDGQLLEDESRFLDESPETLQRLKEGKPVSL